MKKFVEFEVYEYMDMYPSKEVRIFEGKNLIEIQSVAISWAKEMTNVYSGGPTRFVKILDKSEAIELLISDYRKCLMEDRFPDEDNIEDALKVTSENNIRSFFECYGRNSNKEELC